MNTVYDIMSLLQRKGDIEAQRIQEEENRRREEEEHKRAIWKSIVNMGIAVGLNFIPGIGPYASLAYGGAQAAKDAAAKKKPTNSSFPDLATLFNEMQKIKPATIAALPGETIGIPGPIPGLPQYPPM